MAYTTVNKSTDHFNTLLYTGTGSSNALTGVGFQPDMTWIKVRSESNNHELYDVVRGVTKRIYPDLSNAEDTNTAGLTAFGTDGFTVNTGGAVNGSSKTYVARNWKTQGSAGSSNTNGSIDTTTTSVNTTAGISLGKFTATGSAATVGHGLGVAPAMIIVKRTSATADWQVYHKSLTATHYLEFSQPQASAAAGGTRWNDTEPTSSVFSIGNEWNNGSELMAYCFAEIKGFSSFGKYTGNGNANGAFIYTGFKPAMVISKTTGSGDWRIFDNKRNTINPTNAILYPSDPAAEGTETFGDFLSNGFKLRSANSNSNGQDYVYMAFAEEPFVGTTNIPTTGK